jgi:hypothetical protein
MNLPVGLKLGERLHVQASNPELPRFDSDRGGKFAHRGVERIHAHRALRSGDRSRKVARGAPISRHCDRVDVVFVCSEIEFAQMPERCLVAA